jgi:DNA-binding PadR family transcriptional regulator
VTAVFSHGRLRLYLLKLLSEGAKHGYELIRLLENRFLGLYAPSAGTIYPRLARLEAEGLVTHTAAGGRKVYEITDAGRAELRARADELAELESDIRASVEDLAGLANEIQHEVRGSVRDLKRELREAARETSAGRYHAPRTPPPPYRQQWEAPPNGGAELERRLLEFTAELRRLVGGLKIDETTVREVGRALDTALVELRRALRR